MPLMEQLWLVMDVQGRTLAEAHTHAEAVEIAYALGLAPIQDELEDLEEGFDDEPELRMAANPARERPSVKLALQRLLIPAPVFLPEIDFTPAGIEAAFEELRDYFPAVDEQGRLLKAGLMPKDMWTAILTEGNVKLEKSKPYAHVKGLSLLPSTRWLRMIKKIRDGILVTEAKVTLPDTEWAERVAARTASLKLAAPRPQGGHELCVGASPWCRATCLAETGRNHRPGVYAKHFALTTAFLLHPRAFLVMLWRAFVQLRDGAKRAGKEPMVRLNMLSDVPWEAVYPQLFEEFSHPVRREKLKRVQCYDYTKLVDRWASDDAADCSGFGNYDLTFSFGGCNQEEIWEEVTRGRRIAVVFTKETLPTVGSRLLWPNPYAEDEQDGMLLPVVSGMDDDVRSRDPQGSLVALQWLPPKVRGSRTPPKSFVVKAWRHPQGLYLLESHTPRQTNIED